MPIYFHTEDVSYSLKKSSQINAWIKRVIKSEKKKAGIINFIFCSDEYLLNLNRQYLKHDYYTDIITFDQSVNEEIISGDIYISIERVRENALMHEKQRKSNRSSVIGNQKQETSNRTLITDNQLPVTSELHRVMIHGVLHLLGYDDKTDSSKKKMRKKEGESLTKLIVIKSKRKNGSRI